MMERSVKKKTIRRKLNLDDMDICHILDESKKNVSGIYVNEEKMDIDGDSSERILELSTISGTIAARLDETESKKNVCDIHVKEGKMDIDGDSSEGNLDLSTVSGTIAVRLDETDMIQCASKHTVHDAPVQASSSNIQESDINLNKNSKHYKLRGSTKKTSYFDDEDDTDDYSPDGSEYLPSPDRTVTISPSILSSLGGDSQVIDNFLINHENITRTPSTVSNLSLVLNYDFVASPDVIYKADHTIFSTPKQLKKRKDASNCLEKHSIVDITLKPQLTDQISYDDVENLEETLTPNKTDKSSANSLIESNMPLTISPRQNSQSSSESKFLENRNEKNKTEYLVHNYQIIIEIEREFPETVDSNAIETISDEANQEKTAPDSLTLNKDKLKTSIQIDKNETVQNQITVSCTNENMEDLVVPGKDENNIETLSLNPLNLCNNSTVHEPNVNPIRRDETPLQAVDQSKVVMTNKPDEQNSNNDYKNKHQIEIEPGSPVIDITGVDQAKSHSSNDPVCSDTPQKLMREIFITDKKQNYTNKEKNLLEDVDPLDLSNESTIYEPETSQSKEDEEANACLERPKTPSGVILIEAPVEIHSENSESTHATGSENQDPSISKKLTRKRKLNSSEWRDTKNKLLKNSGEAYEGARSKKQYEKKNVLSNCVCLKECGLKFDNEQREAIHNKFYKLASRENQWLFISKHVRTQDVKRITVMRKNNRTQTIKYYLPLNGEEIQVCKIFFLRTLSICEEMVYTAIEKHTKSDSFTDNQGKHQNRPHKMMPSTEESIRTHIDMFPKVESHYTRKESKREYLSESLNISKMYRMYTDWFKERNYTDDVKMASKRQYETVFNTKYNYSFFKPKKDQCTLCAKYEQAESNEKSSIEDKYRTHLKMKERIREMKKEEKEKSHKANTIVAIFDLEKVLNVPQSEVSVFHYKRKYPVYNFTVFDASNKRGYCYVWHAQTGKKGCIEIGSCLLKFMRAAREKGIRNILFYSDGCYGQNKNRYIFALYVYAAKTLQLDITHKFFVTGHSQNKGDSMHACIERNMKNKTVYTPDQIYGIIMNAKVTGEKYTVDEINQSEFLDIKKLVVPKRWQQDKNGEKVGWSEVMEVSVCHENPNSFLFKYDFNGEYSELDINPLTARNRQRRGRIPLPQQVQLVDDNVELKPAYDKPLPVSKALYNDLQSLCSSEAIPKHYHGFYNSLTYDDNPSGGNNNSSEEDSE